MRHRRGWGIALGCSCVLFVGALGTRAVGQFPGEMEEPVPPTRNDREQPWTQPSPGYGEAYEPIRREPAPIPPGRPLPFYPPEPPAAAPAGSALSNPPDFVGSANGYLEIPVGQTAVLPAREAFEASPRDPQVARVVARQRDRVLVRGLFPGRTLVDVWRDGGKETYLVRVR